ncbi:MAG: response regulator [Myxococcota bacterium]|nr:response regulator [Myxococcota bacterium]
MQGRKILLVDDYRVIRELLKIYLSSSNATVLEASDGEQALAMIRSSAPDLVIADMQMPKLSGLELCKQMQGDPALSQIPVVILTGNNDPKAVDACKAAGAREVLQKPISPAVLMSAINRIVPIAA